MEFSTIIPGSHSVTSTSGNYVACIANGKLRVCSAVVPERCTEFNTRISAKDVSSLKWSYEDQRIAIVSAQNIEIIDLNDSGHVVRIDNGSGGLGRFAFADFVGSNRLIMIWEFGRVKLWDLNTGKGLELGDSKTSSSGPKWQLRPGDNANATSRPLAILSRPGADDTLSLYLPALNKLLSSVKLPTADAQSISWSPDGRWICVLDTPISSSSVHFYTPDGHHFRSYPRSAETAGLGFKAAIWSKNSQIVALTSFEGQIVVLNAQTFAPMAIIEHTTTIDQRTLPSERHAPIWQEVASSSGERSYIPISQPFSPPLSRTKQSTEPSELGIAEACFSSDGNYLATRDERMLNTVWVWNVITLSAHAMLIQHNNVRRMHWHPSQPETLMLNCGEGIAYLFSVLSRNRPAVSSFSDIGAATVSWLPTPPQAKKMILFSTKSSFRLFYPEGKPEVDELPPDHDITTMSSEEDNTEDSLYAVLSGRKPLPPKTEPSYTERIDMEVESEDVYSSTRIDDTFVGRKGPQKRLSLDPLDDSEIF